MDITVAICTWNRADLLDQTLTRMRDLKVPERLDWELLVVNNNCTDDTDSVIARHAEHLPIRRLFEPKQGHSNARNCAVAAAGGDYLLWTDDDVLVSPDWLAEYARASREWPEAAYFGGPIDPWFASEPPRWMRRHLDRLGDFWAIRQLGDTARELQKGEKPYGANLAFRTEVLRQHRFDTRLGRVGSELVSGDETELLERLASAGLAGVWVGTARVRHYIPVHRLRARYLWEYRFCTGREHVRLGQYSAWMTRKRAPRWVVRKCIEATVKMLALNPWKNSAWLQAFLDSAYYRGVIFEARRTSV